MNQHSVYYIIAPSTKSKQAPAIFGDEEFTGYGGMAGGNIVSMLEMLEGEQASLIVELRTTENANKQAYNHEKTALSADKAAQKVEDSCLRQNKSFPIIPRNGLPTCRVDED